MSTRSFARLSVLICLTTAGPSRLLADLNYPTRLETNMGPMTFAKQINGSWVTWYDYTHTDNQHPAIYGNCTAGSSVRSCFQQIMQQYHSQNISGVRFQFNLDDVLDAGNNIIPQWLAGLNNFFEDLHAAGIPKAL